MKPKVVSTILALLLVCFCMSAKTNVMAQIGGGGSIQGIITDPSGAVVPGATVVAKNVATGVETTKQTNEAGLYVIALATGRVQGGSFLHRFSNLDPGEGDS